MGVFGRLWADLSIQEVSGSLGDLGTLLPLLVGLVESRGLDLGTTLILTGVYNIASGLLFGIPMPVQPMKAIAAVALSEVALTVPQIAAAGIFVGAVVFVLGVTRLIGAVHSLIPFAVVRGLQLGVGLNLAQKGVGLIWFADVPAGSVRPLWGADGLVLGLAAAALVLAAAFPYERLELPLSQPKAPAEQEPPAEEAAAEAAPGQAGASNARGPWVPAALVIVAAGVLLTLALHPRLARSVRLGPSIPQLVVPSRRDWQIGVWRGGAAQLPLTLLNSVVAVCQLARERFPGAAPSPRRVSVSVGTMNLLGTWLGCMPCCHGAGGLAAQARFGARTGAAPALLGAAKLALGLLFGSSLLALLRAFPKPLLGAMLLFSGAELAATCRAQTGERGAALMLLTAAAILGMRNTAAGFLAGAAGAALLFLLDGARGWRRRRAAARQYQQLLGRADGEAA